MVLFIAFVSDLISRRERGKPGQAPSLQVEGGRHR